MATASYFIVVNPTANREGALRAWCEAKAVLDEAGVRYEVACTSRRGEATALAAAAAASGWPAVVAVGGDGTINEVANGLLQAANGGPTIPLGALAVGSGNDFAHVLDLPVQQPAAAARRLLAARPRRIDAGRVDGRYFVNAVGVGLDARVAIEAQAIRRLRGGAIYFWALLKVLRGNRPPAVQVVLDGQEVADRRLTLVAVGNGSRYGGGFRICPEARLDDGLFDVCVADALGIAGILRFVPRVLQGRHIGRPEVHIHRARTVMIRSPDPLPVQADGEILARDAHQVELENLPGRLTVLV